MFSAVRLLLAVVLCTAALCCQRIRISNISPDQQYGWVDFTVPADSKPEAFMAFGEDRWPVVRGMAVGHHGYQAHVWVGALRGKSSVEGDLVPWPEEAPVEDDDQGPFGYVASPWVIAKKLVPEVIFRVDGVKHRPEVVIVGGVPVDSNAARAVYHLRTVPVEGLVWEGWIYVPSFSEKVDVEFTITWSDRSESALTKSGVSCYVNWQHEVQLDFAKRLGVKSQKWIGENQWRWQTNLLWNTTLGDGEQYAYSGIMLCREKGGKDWLSSIREANLKAARGGPLRAECLDWDGKWLAFGVAPQKPRQFKSADATHAAFMAFLDERGSYFDERPLASRKRTGATGAQVDFGAAQGGYAVTLGDPRRIYELQYSVTSYMRGFHHREATGAPLTHAEHPNWQTWSQYSDHRLGGDMLGKTNRPYSLRAGVSQFTGWDDQHRSQNFELALYALRPSFMLRQAFLDGLESDVAQMNPTRSGAPRAQGRLMMVWANWLLLLDEVAQEKVRFIMDRRLANALRNWDGKGLSDSQIRVIDGHVKDDRVLKGVDAWMPWQTNIACMGYYAGYRVTGDLEYRDLALALARSITRAAFFKDDAGAWHVCTGVPWNGGVQLDASFYKADNPGLKISNSFHAWTAGACAILLELDPTDGPDSVRAEEILRYFYGEGYGNWADSAWMAVR